MSGQEHSPVPFTLSVRSPAAVPGYPYTDAITCQADFHREQMRFSGLQEELRTRFHCTLETSGLTPNFTVIVMRDDQMERVRALICGQGALLDDGDIHELSSVEASFRPDSRPAPPHRHRWYQMTGAWQVKPTEIAPDLMENDSMMPALTAVADEQESSPVFLHAA